jgi:hypothetical protein
MNKFGRSLFYLVHLQQQQQQQHSLLSQASWGRLEMKPKRETGRHIKGHKGHKTKRGHGSGTLIANLQVLLFIAKSLEIC